VPVIAIDSDAPDSKRLFFVGTTTTRPASWARAMLAKGLGGKGSVVVFTNPSRPI